VNRGHRRYREFRLAVLRDPAEQTCALCGWPVDKNQPYDGGRNPWAPTLEHRTPISQGGALLDRENATIAHKGCQDRQGQRLATDRRRAGPRRQSRRWR
jgi:5-methylcytosine-specific restriction endonuclease McrA